MSVKTKTETATTQEKLLAAGDMLFLERGYDGVSTRDLTEAAGVNVAAVNYHFGSKEKLYVEVFRQRLLRTSADVVRAVTLAAGEDDPPDLRKVISAYVSGFLGSALRSSDAQRFMALVSREIAEQGVAVDVLLKEVVLPVRKQLIAAIVRAMPSITQQKAALCVSSIAGQIFHFAGAREVIKQVVGRGYSAGFIEEITEHIIDFSLKGIGR